MQEGPHWFADTSDVVCQNLSLIMERHKEIAGGTCIGFDADADRKRFMVGPGGIVVVPRGEPTSTRGELAPGATAAAKNASENTRTPRSG